jgi:hypothetical protein
MVEQGLSFAAGHVASLVRIEESVGVVRASGA